MKKIAIDSNILSYFVEVTKPDYDPFNDDLLLRKEKIAALRIALYPNDIQLYILPMVETEWNCIQDEYKRYLHSMSTFCIFSSRPWKISQSKLDKYTSKLLQKHPKINDCCLLAQAGLTGMELLLTNDNNFIKRLKNKTKVLLMKPSEYMDTLDIKKGTPPKRRPTKDNPLYNKTWYLI